MIIKTYIFEKIPTFDLKEGVYIWTDGKFVRQPARLKHQWFKVLRS